MRIADLSRASGVSTATIKYYIREGLLPSGLLTSSNQARYTEDHVHRLRLIRALLDQGGLTVSRIRSIVTALDDADGTFDPGTMTADGPYAGPLSPLTADPRTVVTVRSLVERQGWNAPVDSPEFAAVVELLDILRELGQERFADRLDDYAEAAERAAAVDEEVLRSCDDSRSRAEGLVVGTVLGDSLLSALRRLARTGRSTPPVAAFVTSGASEARS
ncbi:MerR-like DNA binding protein [Streptomyces sp. PanSC19]|uniref:MerR family transcriptional regulator n=1 Tax=Streptomyces sp. PanSC19 TaxID=1520455 RepID=UPI000F483510|nr:MerR family transcriptional regulator [Streptomyces sp. PanSC19]ROQ23231.1 MerR-like DNA binding protein [Streptomyces sp. PanSC19]